MPLSTGCGSLFAANGYGRGAGRSESEAFMSDPKNIVILLLLAGIAVLGYLYYDSQRTAVRIDVPGFKLEAK